MKKVFFLFAVLFVIMVGVYSLSANNSIKYLQKRTVACLENPQRFQTNAGKYGIENTYPEGHPYVEFAQDVEGCFEWMGSYMPLSVYAFSKIFAGYDFYPKVFPGYSNTNDTWNIEQTESLRDRFVIQNGHVVKQAFTYKLAEYPSDGLRIVYQFSEGGELEKVHNCLREDRSDGMVGYICDPYDPENPGRFESLWNKDKHFVPQFEVFE
jgi:hypothetical protein